MLTPEQYEQLSELRSMEVEVVGASVANESMLDIMWLRIMSPTELAIFKALLNVLEAYTSEYGGKLLDVYSGSFDPDISDEHYPIKRDYSFIVRRVTLCELTSLSLEEVAQAVAGMEGKGLMRIIDLGPGVRVILNFARLSRMCDIWQKHFGQWTHEQVMPRAILSLLLDVQNKRAVVDSVMSEIYEELSKKE